MEVPPVEAPVAEAKPAKIKAPKEKPAKAEAAKGAAKKTATKKSSAKKGASGIPPGMQGGPSLRFRLRSRLYLVRRKTMALNLSMDCGQTRGSTRRLHLSSSRSHPGEVDFAGR